MEQPTSPRTPDAGAASSCRPVYEPPRLRRIGTIADITRGTGSGPGNLIPGSGAPSIEEFDSLPSWVHPRRR